MKSTRLTLSNEESTFDIIAALCAVHQPKYLLSDKSDWKFDDDIDYFTDDKSIFTDDKDESYHGIFKSRTWTACHLDPEASPAANTSDSKEENSNSLDDIDTFISQRIDLDDTSCHSFEVGLEGNYSKVVTSASTSEEYSVQLLEAKDFAWGIGEKAIETQLASLSSRPPTQTPQGRIEPAISKQSLEDKIARKVVHQKITDSLTLDNDTYFDLEQFKHNFFGVDASKHYRSHFERMLGRRNVVHRKSSDSITLDDDTSFDLEQFEHDFFHMSSSKHYISNRFERLFGRLIL
jgi:hypothetical protein